MAVQQLAPQRACSLLFEYSSRMIDCVIDTAEIAVRYPITSNLLSNAMATSTKVNIEDSTWLDIDTPDALNYINNNRNLFE